MAFPNRSLRLIAPLLILLVVGGLFLFSSTAQAQVTQQMTYQAAVSDANGAPLADGTYSMKFSLYTAASGGVPIWTAAGSFATPSAISVSVTSSRFSVNLGGTGQNSLADVDWNQDTLYLGITIGADSEMTPRRRLTASAQALFSDNSRTLMGMSPSSTAWGNESLFTIHQTEGSAATGTRTALEVRSAGTGATDYLLRGVNDLGSTVFSVNRDGTVTSESLVATTGTVTHVDSAYTQARLASPSQIQSLTTFANGVAAPRAIKTYGNRLFVLNGSGITVLDTSYPDVERVIATSLLSAVGNIRDFVVYGNTLFIIYDDGFGTNYFATYDIQDLSNPQIRAALNIATADFSASGKLLIHGSTAYVFGSGKSLYVIDVKNPGGLELKNTIVLTEDPRDIAVHRQTLFLLGTEGPQGALVSYDIQDPFAPVQLDSFALAEGVRSMVIRGDIAYVTNTTENQVSVVDISIPSAITEHAALTGITAPTAITELGGKLFIGAQSGDKLRVFDTASTTAPTLLGSFDAAGAVSGFAWKGDVLYVGVDSVLTGVRVYRVPGVRTNGFTAGQASVYQLRVEGEAFIGGNASIEGGIYTGRGLYSEGAITAVTSSTNGSVASFVNNSTASSGAGGWGVFTNRLLVGDNESATGTQAYVSTFAYNSAQSRFGVCLDNTDTASTCLDFDGGTIYSILADDAIGANAFDLAERYAISDSVEPGDVLVLDTSTPFHMKKSPGQPYDQHLSGVVSTRPGFLLGTGGNASVALVGRVPVKVTVANGAIAQGDALTSSAIPGVAMKATQPGRILGRALQSATEDGVIEVYLQPGFDASTTLRADGTLTTVHSDLAFVSESATAAEPTQASRSLTFSSSRWNGSAAVTTPFELFARPTSTAMSEFVIRQASSTIFSLTQDGSLRLAGDLQIAGKLYPSARGRAQQDAYIFVDDTVPGSSYISTNADGWQSMDGYDYAERYVSPDQLEAGDVVTVKRSGRLYVQRSMNAQDMVVGIVSTKPGFIAGQPQEDAYPIALAGRVPTKVSAIGGAIQIGDALAASSIPGVAVKATRPGPIVGFALESYSGGDVGKIEVFVNPIWWGGETAEASASAVAQKQQGFAEIFPGQTRVKVALRGFGRYPYLQVTPYAQTEKGWWIEGLSANGFDLVLGEPALRSIRFAWKAEETPQETTIDISTGRRLSLDPYDGTIVYPPGEGSDTVSKPTEEPEAEVGEEEAPAAEIPPVTEEGVVPEEESASEDEGDAPAADPEPITEPEPVIDPEVAPEPEPTPDPEPVVETPVVEEPAPVEPAPPAPSIEEAPTT